MVLYSGTSGSSGGFDFYDGMKETVRKGKAEVVGIKEFEMKPGLSA